ncbi:PGF-pre-PGF domain-containing protein, partial [Candidatus Woesearchaeota archaeon]|nr:PGF-pre-PGF domain-containing protein [Candidatus Woesearchaeota archaeon]
ESNTVKLYVDGQLRDSDTFTGGGNDGSVTLGSLSSGQYFNGTIDDLMIFNRSLTPEQILNLYNNQTYLIDANETSPADNYTACITPNDGTQDGTEVCSNQLIIQSAPVVSTPVLNSTLGTNLTSENLTVYFTPTDADSDPVKNITDWKTDASSNELITDGDMEAVGVVDWTAGGGANLKKATTSVKIGVGMFDPTYYFSSYDGQSLAVVASSAQYPSASQTVLTVGRRYRVRGAAYAITEASLHWPDVRHNSNVLWTGSNSATWQEFDVDFVAEATSIEFRAAAFLTGEAGVLFDNVSVEEVQSIAVLNMPFERISDSVFNATKDYSDSNNNGSEQGGVTWNATGGHDGKGAFEFDGVDDRITTPFNPIDLSNDFTITFWQKGDTDHTDKFLSADDGGTDRFYIDDNSGTYRVAISDFTNTTSIAVDGNWHFISATIENGNSGKFYIDGTLETHSLITLELPDRNLVIGSNSLQTDSYVNGTIDDVMIFNRSLSADQINALYNNKSYLISSDETNPGERWISCITPNDGAQDGTEVCSNLLIIQTAPNTVQVVLNATSLNNYSADDLTCYTNITDEDEDPVYANYTWYKDGTQQSTGQSPTFTQGTTDNIANISSTSTANGENWTCEVRAYDGAGYESDTTNASLVIIAKPTTPTTTTETPASYVGAGGGGGGSLGTPTSFSKWFDFIEKGQPITLTTPEIASLEKIDFELTQDLEKQWVVIKKITTLPGDFNGKWYEIFNVNTNKITNNLQSAKIYFNVQREWLNKKGLERFDIALYRWSGYYWQELPVNLRDIDNTNFYYTAITPRFSYFIIGEREREGLPKLKEILEWEEPTTELELGYKQLAIDTLTIVETILQRATDLNIEVPEAEKIMSQAQEAYLQGNYHQAFTLAEEARLSIEEVLPVIEPESLLKRMWKSISHYTKTIFDKTSNLAGKAISEQSNISFKDYSLYWLGGVIALIVIALGALIIHQVKKKPTKKKKTFSISFKINHIKKKIQAKTKSKKKSSENTKKVLSTIILVLLILTVTAGIYLILQNWGSAIATFASSLWPSITSIGKTVVSFIITVGKGIFNLGWWLIPILTAIAITATVIYALKNRKHTTRKTLATIFSILTLIEVLSLSYCLNDQIIPLGSLVGSVVTEIGKNASSIMNWLAPILAILILGGMLIYIFKKRDKSEPHEKKAKALTRFIHQAKKKGLSKKEIKKMLVENGWPQNTINDYLK